MAILPDAQTFQIFVLSALAYINQELTAYIFNQQVHHALMGVHRRVASQTSAG